jgi:hypothetical protein
MDIAHLLDFNFSTNALGIVRIGALETQLYKNIRNVVESSEPNAHELARRIFVASAQRLAGDDAADNSRASPAITSEEAAELTSEELDKFAEQYGARFFGKNDGKGPADGQPTGVDFLVFKIKHSNQLDRERHAKLLADAKKAYSGATSRAMLDALGATNSISQLRAAHHALEEHRRWNEIRKIIEPIQAIRDSLGSDFGWRKALDEISKSRLQTNHFSGILDSHFGTSSLLRQLHESPSWLSSLQHARNTYAANSIAETFREAQKAFQSVSRSWELPNQLVNSVGALAALQEQIGRLTLPVIELNSAVALARHLGSEGLQAQLAALGINEYGELTEANVAEPDVSGFLTNNQRDLLTLLAIIFTLLIFTYQEHSSGQWQSSVDGNLASQKLMLETQAKKLESLSILVERALVKETTRVSTRFVVLDRVATVRARPGSGASVESNLLPREVVTLVSEQGKWIEVRYYHWSLKEYKTGWILKKYLTRVPASQQADD